MIRSSMPPGFSVLPCGGRMHSALSSKLPFAGVATLLMLSASLAGQSAPAGGTGGPPNRARTPDGHPDLQGVYNVATLTPVERPDGLPLVITDEQARRLERNEAQRVQRAA